MSIQRHRNRLVGLLALIVALMPFSARAGQIGASMKVNGFTFINFDPSGATDSTANGISNNGHLVITVTKPDGTFTNYTATPAKTTQLNLGTTAMAFGSNSGNTIVGTQNGAAFFMTAKGSPQPLPSPALATAAFGINDKGQIVGQSTTGSGQMPGFILRNMHTPAITINAPSGANIVNAQGINNFGLIVGSYVGTDGQTHGFIANLSSARNGTLTGTAITDPVIPNVPGEPGATFVFSQLLGVNDAGVAVGYYGDSTTSQHGFIYDTNTGQYTFLDDPAEAFNNGVEVTQITGINNSAELTGFYTDGNGVTHSFIACPPYSFCPSYGSVLP